MSSILKMTACGLFGRTITFTKRGIVKFGNTSKKKSASLNKNLSFLFKLHPDKRQQVVREPLLKSLRPGDAYMRQ